LCRAFSFGERGVHLDTAWPKELQSNSFCAASGGAANRRQSRRHPLGALESGFGSPCVSRGGAKSCRWQVFRAWTSCVKASERGARVRGVHLDTAWPKELQSNSFCAASGGAANRRQSRRHPRGALERGFGGMCINYIHRSSLHCGEKENLIPLPNARRKKNEQGHKFKPSRQHIKG